MRLLNIAAASGATMATSAHDASNGNCGSSSDAGDATLSSSYVEHAEKHSTMQKGV